MYRTKSFLVSAALALCAGAALCVAAVRETVAMVTDTVHRAVRWLFSLDLFNLQPPDPARQPQILPKVQLLRAVAFKLRMIKRGRPDVNPRYRLCPSI